MKREFEVDELIREALRSEGLEDLGGFEMPGLSDVVTDVFRNRNRWIGGMITANLVVATALAIVCAVKFFGTDSPVLMVRWGAGFFFGVIVAVGCKLWYWMQMDRITLSREMKRVELGLIQLASELRGKR